VPRSEFKVLKRAVERLPEEGEAGHARHDVPGPPAETRRERRANLRRVPAGGDPAAVAPAERRERVAPTARKATPFASSVRRIADEIKAMGLDAEASIEKMVEMIAPLLPDVLDTRGVASQLDCSYGEARNRMLDGRIKAWKDGRWLRSCRQWVDDYLSSVTVRPPATREGGVASPSRRRRSATAAIGTIALEFLRERGK
jgi:hypothetical protein